MTSILLEHTVSPSPKFPQTCAAAFITLHHPMERLFLLLLVYSVGALLQVLPATIFISGKVLSRRSRKLVIIYLLRSCPFHHWNPVKPIIGTSLPIGRMVISSDHYWWFNVASTLPQRVSYTRTIASTNPNSGVNISASPMIKVLRAMERPGSHERIIMAHP